MSRAIERAEASGPRLSHSIIKQWLRTVWAAMTEDERREYLPPGCEGATPRFINLELKPCPILDDLCFLREQ